MRVGFTIFNTIGSREWLEQSILVSLGKTKYKRIMNDAGEYVLVENKDLLPDISAEQIKKEIVYTEDGEMISGIWESR